MKRWILLHYKINGKLKLLKHPELEESEFTRTGVKWWDLHTKMRLEIVTLHKGVYCATVDGRDIYTTEAETSALNPDFPNV